MPELSNPDLSKKADPMPNRDSEAMDAPLNLEAFLPYRATRLATLLSKGLAAEYQQHFDISVAEWRILAHLTQQSEISVRDMFDRVDMDRVRVTRTVQRLHSRGLVDKRRHPVDRRLLQLALTDEGAQLAAALSFRAKRFAAQAVEDIDPRSQQELLRLIGKIEENLGSASQVT